jgi:3-dehydroquinate dehydratase/shikimate dehydrogenase
VCAARFGSAWTYAGTLDGIGQIGPAALVEQYGFRSITADTRIFGIVGRPLSHSVSPAMHNAALRAAGIDAVYLSLPAVDVDDFFAFAGAFDVSGASVTIPYKVDLAARADEVDPLVRRVGALNTLRMVGGRWHGANTDVAGFLEPLRRRGLALRGLRAAVLGAGGSARAVTVALTGAGAIVTVHARDRERAQRLAEASGAQAAAWPPASGSWELLVNCTPVGMHPAVEVTPVPAELLTGAVVYDLVYNPLETRLLADARRAGCQPIGGLDMLVAQAQDQFHWWTGQRPADGVMRKAALARLAEFKAHEDHDV